MKNIKHSLTRFLGTAIFLALLVSCQESETTIFDQPAGVHFTLDAYSYSFKEKIGVETDTIKLPMEIYGKLSETEREVKVTLVENDTARENTLLPERYKILKSTIPANNSVGTVSLELNYGPELDDSVYVFHLQIEANDEFQEITYQKRIVKVEVTAKEIQPANWAASLYYYFGDYSTRWWGFIKETTQRTSLPYRGSSNPDPELWNMPIQEFLANVAVVKTALRKYNEGPDGPLTHDDGPSKGKPVEMRQ